MDHFLDSGQFLDIWRPVILTFGLWSFGPWPLVKINSTWVIKCTLLGCILVPTMKYVGQIGFEIWTQVYLISCLTLKFDLESKSTKNTSLNVNQVVLPSYQILSGSVKRFRNYLKLTRKKHNEKICNIGILIEKCLDHQQELYHNFIDFKKTFDRVWHEGLWDILRQFGNEEDLIQVFESLYKHASSTVHLGVELKQNNA